MTPGFGRLLIFVGIIFVAAGIIFSLNIQIPWLGKLPGDIAVKKENFQFYFPLTTCILISVVLSFLFYLFRK